MALTPLDSAAKSQSELKVEIEGTGWGGVLDAGSLIPHFG